MSGREVHAILMRVNQIKDNVHDLLRQGVRELSMTLGVVAQIDGDNYEIVAVHSNSGAYVAGEKYTLGQTFCRKVFEQQQVIAETAIDNSPLALHHPLYRSLPLECYIARCLSRIPTTRSLSFTQTRMCLQPSFRLVACGRSRNAELQRLP